MPMIDEWNFRSIKVNALIIHKDNIKNIIWNNSICARIWPITYLYATKPNVPGARVVERWSPCLEYIYFI